MNLYKFSPIKTEKELNEAYEYIASELRKLSKEVLIEELPINTLKLFAHYFDEYEYIYNAVSEKGDPAPFNSKTSYYSVVDEKISGEEIK